MSNFVNWADAWKKRTYPEDFGQDLTDYLWLLRRSPMADRDQDVLVENADAVPRTSADVREAPRENELTDWIYTFKAYLPSAGDHALARWKARHTDPWLVAALVTANSSTPGLQQLLETAAKVPPGSAAFATASFYRARLLAESGHEEEARRAIDGLLARTDDTFPPSSRNLLLALRLKLARNLDEFLEFAPRVPVDVQFLGAYADEPATEANANSSASPGRSSRAYFDADSVWTMRKYFSTAALVRAVQAAKLPPGLQRDVALSTWVRAHLAGDIESAKALAPFIETITPNLKLGFEEYTSATDADARNFVAAFLMLHQPGLRPYFAVGVNRPASLGEIDNYRDNWWCGPQNADNGSNDPLWDDTYTWAASSAHLEPVLHGARPQRVEFLEQKEVQQAQTEIGRLKQIAGAPDYFAEIVLDWAEKHPDDPRVPEALHLVVRATRYGCADRETSKYSKAAFERLYRRYRKSEWTERTKYWF
jgi:hypothetical protein